MWRSLANRESKETSSFIRHSKMVGIKVTLIAFSIPKDSAVEVAVPERSNWTRRRKARVDQRAGNRTTSAARSQNAKRAIRSVSLLLLFPALGRVNYPRAKKHRETSCCRP